MSKSDKLSISVGDAKTYGTTDDGLALHKEADDTLWTRPLTDIVRTATNGCQTVNLPLNRFIRDEWTCENVEEPSDINSYDVEYSEGYILNLPGIGDVEVSGTYVSHTDDRYIADGSFSAPNELEVVVDLLDPHGDIAVTYTYQCWEGGPMDRPVTPEE
jgi:hypothetical protein